MDEISTFSKIKRYAQTSKIAGGFATRLIGEKYFKLDIDDAAYAKFLKESLGQLKGPLMKAAQFLCTIPDTLPKEYYDLITLQTQAPSMGIPFVKRRMKRELGLNWQDNFLNFDFTAHAAASLGQVHKAQHLNGDYLAVKLQYPGMTDITESDLQQLKLFFTLYETWNKAIDTQNIFEEIKEGLMQELNYNLEKQNMNDYHVFFKSDPLINVPKTYDDLSTDRLLTMEWIEGESILNYENADQAIRNHLGHILFQSWYKPFYSKGWLHGDPHPGNYLVTNSNELGITLLDFGCIRRFDKNVVEGSKNLYFALLNNDKKLAVHAFEQWGFKALTHDLIDIIMQWAKLLYDPLLDDRIRLIQKDKSAKESLKLAKEIHQSLKKMGGICPPKTFVFMDRAAVGIGSVLMRLGAYQNWHQIFLKLIDSK